jgi:glyoxylase-like metal-dependent hydrolase (beta-lactamase superfamily II)
MKVEAKLLTAGSCRQIEKISNVTKPFQKVQFPAHFIYIKHPTKGHILVDTGYSEHFLKETRYLPYSIYAKVTPVQFHRENSAVEQLKRLGVEKEQVQFVFISHFHADHVSGLRDFPNATFICSKVAFAFVKNKNGLNALKHGYIPTLLPDDFEERVEYIENKSKVTVENKQLNELSNDGQLYDVLGDQSLLAMDLSGHAKGQFGLYFETSEHKVWWIADAVWDSDAYQYDQLPSRISKLILYDYQLFRKTMKHIHLYHKRYRDIFIIPAHCRSVVEEWYKKTDHKR